MITRGFPHQDGVSSIDGDLVVSCIAVGQAEVEVLDLQVNVGEDQLRLDVVPASRRKLNTLQLLSYKITRIAYTVVL